MTDFAPVTPRACVKTKRTPYPWDAMWAVVRRLRAAHAAAYDEACTSCAAECAGIRAEGERLYREWESAP